MGLRNREVALTERETAMFNHEGQVVQYKIPIFTSTKRNFPIWKLNSLSGEPCFLSS